jgi:hypothetical protein
VPKREIVEKLDALVALLHALEPRYTTALKQRGLDGLAQLLLQEELEVSRTLHGNHARELLQQAGTYILSSMRCEIMVSLLDGSISVKYRSDRQKQRVLDALNVSRG